MSDRTRLKFNPPPGWPKPPDKWTPPKGWTPDPSWPKAPPGWQLWVDDDGVHALPTKSAESQTSGVDAAANRVDQRIALLEAENAALRSRWESEGANATNVVLLDDERILQEVGIYRYHHPLESAIAYMERLDDLSTRIAEMIKTDVAIEKSNMFTFNGSLAKGRAMTKDLGKLMLRAYNAEADNVIRSLRHGNVVTAKKRLEASRAAIANLGKLMEMHISDAFHAIRIEEIEITSDYLMKKQEERELEREERERLREERKVAMELAAERERLDKERSHLVTAIEKLRELGTLDSGLEQKLTEVDSAIAQNDYRAANIRAGYIYVISNRGAFGANVVKIGLTRRLEPLERIDELSDASVPFRFDVHAIFFSQDAVTLENELHKHFSDRRVNWVNMRREFFFATASEVRTVLLDKLGNLLDFREQAESTEYLQSIHYWPELPRPGPSAP